MWGGGVDGGRREGFGEVMSTTSKSSGPAPPEFELALEVTSAWIWDWFVKVRLCFCLGGPRTELVPEREPNGAPLTGSSPSSIASDISLPLPLLAPPTPLTESELMFEPNNKMLGRVTVNKITLQIPERWNSAPETA